jgi:hypothetical protein
MLDLLIFLTIAGFIVFVVARKLFSVVLSALSLLVAAGVLSTLLWWGVL